MRHMRPGCQLVLESSSVQKDDTEGKLTTANESSSCISDQNDCSSMLGMSVTPKFALDSDLD